MKYAIMAVLFSLVFCVFGQKISGGSFGGAILAAPAAQDTADRKVYVPPVPACTIIVYPAIRENLSLGKGDKVRLILRSKPKDSTTYTELWQWDYKCTNADSANLLLKCNFIQK